MKSTANEWVAKPVPKSERKPLSNVTLVWIGFIFFPVAIQTTLTLGQNMTPENLVLAIAIGSFILALCSALSGLVAQDKGMSFSLLAKSVFGEKGYILIAMLPPVCLIGWNSFNLAFVANMTVEVLAVNRLYIVFCALYATWFMLSSILGFKGIVWISRFAVPSIVLILLISGGQVILDPSFWDSLRNTSDDAGISLTKGIVSIVGLFALGASVCSPDIQRFNISLKHAILVSVITFCLAFPLFLILGGAVAVKTGEANIVYAFSKLGILTVGFILLLLLSWTTCDNDYYSASLGLAQIFKQKKWKMVLISALAACFLAILGVQSYLENWLVLMSSIATPAAGVIFADYLAEKKIYNNISRRSDWRVSPLIAWLSGALIAYMSANLEVGIPPLQGIISGFLIHLSLFKVDLENPKNE